MREIEKSSFFKKITVETKRQFGAAKSKSHVSAIFENHACYNSGVEGNSTAVLHCGELEEPMEDFGELLDAVGNAGLGRPHGKPLSALTEKEIDTITDFYRSGVKWNNYTELRSVCMDRYMADLRAYQ